jgi:hypothetical protein
MKAASIFFRHRFIVGRGRCRRPGDGIDHHFQKMADRRKLARIELVKQLMGMLFIHPLISFVQELADPYAKDIRISVAFPRGNH